MATDGEQYLKTPEHLLPWHVRHMLDIYGALIAMVAGCVWLCLTCTRFLMGRTIRGACRPIIMSDQAPLGRRPSSIHWAAMRWLAAAAAAAAVAASAVLTAADTHNWTPMA
jgi:hypothetical protein